MMSCLSAEEVLQMENNLRTEIARLERKLTTAIDHLKDWSRALSAGAKHSVGDHEIYTPQISVASIERLLKTIESLEESNQ